MMLAQLAAALCAAGLCCSSAGGPWPWVAPVAGVGWMWRYVWAEAGRAGALPAQGPSPAHSGPPQS